MVHSVLVFSLQHINSIVQHVRVESRLCFVSVAVPFCCHRDCQTRGAHMPRAYVTCVICECVCMCVSVCVCVCVCVCLCVRSGWCVCIAFEFHAAV